jgi:Flagellar transcriptional activator (FlhC)
MHISNDRYFRERQRHDLALRMIRHEARTCTIKSCTGLTDDRIRRLCKTYAVHTAALPVRRRGKSPRQVAFFTRNAHLLFESSCLTSVFGAFGLLRHTNDLRIESMSLEYGTLFCDAFETHRQISRSNEITFEHAWFLLQQLNEGDALQLTRCRQCHGQYLNDVLNTGGRACPTCRLKTIPTRRRREIRLGRQPRPSVPTGLLAPNQKLVAH